MGTYNYDEWMLIEEMKDFLDDLEGDFNKNDLQNALEFLKAYAPTIDSSSFYENRWHRLFESKRKEQVETK